MTPGRPDTRTESERAHAFSIEIRRANGTDVLALEPVLASDLADLRAEALWLGAARRGRPDLTLEDGVRGPLPALLARDGRTSGAVVFQIGAAAAPPAVEVSFPHHCFAPVAQRAAARCLAEGRLRPGDEYTYRLLLTAEEPSDAGRPGAREGTGSALVRAAAPLARTLPAFARRELATLLSGARAVDAEHAPAGDHAVVFLRTVLERARAIAERGLTHRPPLETGGILLGQRLACPASGEAYVLVEEALEAQHTVAAEFSLEFSSETWCRFAAVLQRRRAHAATAGQLLIGQFHVHPFLPDGGLAPCADCARRALCTRSSARPSADDARWCRAVFHEAPWQLSLMFGLDARGERRRELFGQRGGALARRGYHVVEEIPADSAALSERTAPAPNPNPDPLGEPHVR